MNASVSKNQVTWRDRADLKWRKVMSAHFKILGRTTDQWKFLWSVRGDCHTILNHWMLSVHESTDAIIQNAKSALANASQCHYFVRYMWAPIVWVLHYSWAFQPLNLLVKKQDGWSNIETSSSNHSLSDQMNTWCQCRINSHISADWELKQHMMVDIQ